MSEFVPYTPEFSQFDEEEYYKYLDEKWEEAQDKYKNKLYNEWKSLQKPEKSLKKLPKINISTYPYLPSTMNVYKDIKEKYNLTDEQVNNIIDFSDWFDNKQKLYEFESFFITKNRQRIEKLYKTHPSMVDIEIKKGGVFHENFGMKALLDGFFSGASFGLFRSSHPIYGEQYKRVYSSEYGWGKMAGDLVGFFMLSSLAGALGVTAKVASLANKGKAFAGFLKAIGYPKYVLGKIFPFRIVIKDGIAKVANSIFIKNAGKLAMRKIPVYATKVEAGASGVTAGAIGIITSGIENTVKRFQKEDELSLKEYKKSLPKALMEGFFSRYFAGVINDPQWWPARILGDAIYSMGQQLYNIIDGVQDKIDPEVFWRSFIEGHLLGEIQGRIFRPSKKQVAKMLQSQMIMDYHSRFKEKFPNEPDDSPFLINRALEAYMAELQAGRPFTEGEKVKLVESYGTLLKDAYDVYTKINHPKSYKIDKTEIDVYREKFYNNIKRKYKLSNNQIRRLKKININDREAFLSELEKMGKITTEIEKKEVPTFDDIIEKYSNYDDNVETFMATIKDVLKLNDKQEKELYDLLTSIRDVTDREYKNELKKAKKSPKIDEERRKEIINILNEQGITSKPKYQKINGKLKKVKEGGVEKYTKIAAGIIRREGVELDANDIYNDTVAKLIYKYATDPNFKVDDYDAYFRTMMRNEIIHRAKSKNKEVSYEAITEESGNELPNVEKIDKHNEKVIYAVLKNYITSGKTEYNRRQRALQVIYSLLATKEHTSVAVKLLKKIGIDADINKINNAKKNLKNNLIKQETKTVKKTITSFDPAEAIKLLELAQREMENYNKVSGIRKDISIPLIKQGGVVISVANIYNQILSEYGSKYAKNFIVKTGQVLKDIVDDINASLGRKEEIFLKNPEGNNSTKFVLYSKGLTKDAFEDIVHLIQKRFVTNSTGKYGIIIKSPEGDRLITNFSQATFLHFDKLPKSITSIFTKSNQIDGLIQLISLIRPRYKDNIDTLYFNLKDTTLNEIVKNITNELGVNLKTRTFDEWRAILDENKIQNIGFLLDDMYAVALVNNSIDLDEEIEITMPEASASEKIDRKKFLETMLNLDIIEDTFSQEFVKQDKDLTDALNSTFVRSYNTIKEVKNKFFNSIISWVKDVFSVTEGQLLKSGEALEASKFPYKLASLQNKANIKTADIIATIMLPLKEKIGNEKIEQYYRFIGFLMENELKGIIEKGVTPRELNSKIKWKKNKNIEVALNKLHNFDYFKKYAPEVLSDLYFASNDDYIFSKLLVQEVGIPAEDLINHLKVLYKLQQTMNNQTINAEDMNYNYFKNFKDKLEEQIREKYDIDAKRYDKDNMTDEEFKMKLKEIDNSIMNAGTDAERNDLIKLRNMLESYREIRPDKMSYFHHHIIQMPDNKKKVNTVLKRLLNGESIAGVSVNFDPTMRLLMGRKIPTLPLLIKAGYKIEPNGLITLAGTLNYFWLKLNQREVPLQMITTFLNKWLTVYQVARDNNDPNIMVEFYKDQVDSYLVIPNSKMIEDLKEKVANYERALKVAEKENNINLQAELTQKRDITKSLLNNIQLLFDFYNGRDKAGIGEKVMDEIINSFKGRDKYVPGNVFGVQIRNEIFNQYKSNTFMGRFLQTLLKAKENLAGNDFEGLNEGTSIYEYNGIYFHRIFWKELKNWVFRNETIYKEYNDFWKTAAIKTAGAINRTIKFLRFYNPLIITWNDLAQASIANPSFIFDIPSAIYSVLTKNKKYQQWDETGIFNNSVNITQLLTESLSAVYKAMGQPKILGLLTDRVFNQKGFIRKLAATGKLAWYGMQDVTWTIDKIIRLATAESMYRRFSKIYSPEQARLRAAEWTNLFLIKYAELPQKTRQILNLFFLVPTYRIETWRMYKEIIKSAGRGVTRILGIKDEDPIFKISDNPIRQGIFETAPLIRLLALRTSIKLLFAQLFGFGFESVWDLLYGYRLKKYEEGEDFLSSSIKFLSLGTPLFEFEKVVPILGQRPLNVVLRYNAAGLPGLFYSIFTNRHLITGKRIVTSDNLFKATGQFGMYLINTYLPFAPDFQNYSQEDLSLMKKIITTTRLGYFYSYKSPKTLLNDFREAIDETKTIGERMSAIRRFRYEMQRAYEVLFDEKYKEFSDILDEYNKSLEEYKKQKI